MRVRTGTTVTSTVALPIAVEIQCEGCGHVFRYPAKLQVSGGHSYATPLGIGVEAGKAKAQSLAQERAKENLAKAMDKLKKGDTSLIKEERICPQCGYLQSWMAERHKHPFTNIFASGFLLVISLALTIVFIQELVGVLACGGASLVLIGVLVWSIRKYTYNANKQWFAERGKDPKRDTPPGRSPVNIYLIEPAKK